MAPPKNFVEVLSVQANTNLSIRFLHDNEAQNPRGRLYDFFYDPETLQSFQLSFQISLERDRYSSRRMNHWLSILFNFQLVLPLQFSSALKHIWVLLRTSSIQRGP